MAARSNARHKQEALVSFSTTVLKKAGGSLILTVPAGARDVLALKEGDPMTVSVQGDRLVMQRQKPARKKYTIAQLLAEEAAAGIKPLDHLDTEWLDLKPVGREIW